MVVCGEQDFERVLCRCSISERVFTRLEKTTDRSPKSVAAALAAVENSLACRGRRGQGDRPAPTGRHSTLTSYHVRNSVQTRRGAPPQAACRSCYAGREWYAIWPRVGQRKLTVTQTNALTARLGRRAGLAITLASFSGESGLLCRVLNSDS